MSYVDDRDIKAAVHHNEGVQVPMVSPGAEDMKALGGKTAVVANAEMYAAISETHIKKWSKESFHLYFCIFVAFCCACANGYDGSLMTGILGMPYFKARFAAGENVNTSIIFAIYTVGSMVGAPFAAVLSDRYGRRKAMFAGGIVIIIGMVIAATAKGRGQLVGARFILGLGIAIMTVAAPAYAVEISPPHWRGRCTGFYNCGWFGGSIPAAAVTYGCNFINSDLQWQIPLILQAFACIIVLAAVFFIPESPRFLMANGRQEEAIEFLVKYHGNGDRNSKLVQLEVQEMVDGIQQDGIDKRWWDYRPLFFSHAGRWRMAQVLMISIFGQFSGNGLGYFNTIIFAQLGVDTSAKQLAYNLLNSIISAVGALSGVALSDKMPRRKILVFGTFGCACLLAINAGLSSLLAKQTAAHSITKSVAQGALAAYFLFNVLFSFTYTPLQAVVPTEALETTMRAKGLAASGVIVSAVGFINQFAGPIALGNIGYKYIWVFVGWDVIESIMWYFFCVESQGRTLEQLEWVYDQPNPVKASLKVDKVVLQADGTVAEKIQG